MLQVRTRRSWCAFTSKRSRPSPRYGYTDLFLFLDRSSLTVCCQSAIGVTTSTGGSEPQALDLASLSLAPSPSAAAESKRGDQGSGVGSIRLQTVLPPPFLDPFAADSLDEGAGPGAELLRQLDRLASNFAPPW